MGGKSNKLKGGLYRKEYGMHNKKFCYLQDHGTCKCEDGLCGMRQVGRYGGVLYIAVAKSASTSILTCMNEYVGITNVKDWEFIPLKDVIEDTSFKFSFVRNPYHRLVSCWRQWIHRKDSGLFNNEKLYYQMSWPDFVKAVATIPDDQSNRHYASHSVILKHNRNLLVDFVGKMENITEDWKVIQKMTGLPDLPHLTRGHVKGDEAKMAMYNDELREIVYNRYEDDFVTFEYEK